MRLLNPPFPKTKALPLNLSVRIERPRMLELPVNHMRMIGACHLPFHHAPARVVVVYPVNPMAHHPYYPAPKRIHENARAPGVAA